MQVSALPCVKKTRVFRPLNKVIGCSYGSLWTMSAPVLTKGENMSVRFDSLMGAFIVLSSTESLLGVFKSFKEAVKFIRENYRTPRMIPG